MVYWLKWHFNGKDAVILHKLMTIPKQLLFMVCFKLYAFFISLGFLDFMVEMKYKMLRYTIYYREINFDILIDLPSALSHIDRLELRSNMFQRFVSKDSEMILPHYKNHQIQSFVRHSQSHPTWKWLVSTTNERCRLSFFKDIKPYDCQYCDSTYPILWQI